MNWAFDELRRGKVGMRKSEIKNRNAIFFKLTECLNFSHFSHFLILVIGNNFETSLVLQRIKSFRH
ncbi:hypothetical protein D1AOALGA4SA_10959 [Olavius algarvensis Delta 1 endosymbiont]|nr:hypothetical protein D1AOALGA4SA_10959 [Olavius algarvensis Delta 1 endosymbiont]